MAAAAGADRSASHERGSGWPTGHHGAVQSGKVLVMGDDQVLRVLGL